MRVRNKKLGEYKGQWTEARDADCPYKKCYHPHDVGYRRADGKWIVKMECLTRYHSGCPN
ncbi:MAG: hypothetical protein E3K37_01400 [Candidatus Kuenenia sp.]|nr:hypothetical protein [Candidatus Kuenenia hertensis]